MLESVREIQGHESGSQLSDSEKMTKNRDGFYLENLVVQLVTSLETCQVRQATLVQQCVA